MTIELKWSTQALAAMAKAEIGNKGPWARALAARLEEETPNDPTPLTEEIVLALADQARGPR